MKTTHLIKSLTILALLTHAQASPHPQPGQDAAMTGVPQATVEFRIKQTHLPDFPLPDAEKPRFSRAPKAPHVGPYHTVVVEQYAPPRRSRNGSAYFTIRHYTLSFDGRQLLIESYRIAAPSASLDITHVAQVLHSDIPYQFRQGNELMRFGMDTKGMRIERFETCTINPETGAVSHSETHFPAVPQP